jgi:hypothetical protein
MGPEALLSLVYAWVVLQALVSLWVGGLMLILFTDFEKGCVFLVREYAPVLFILQFAATDLGGPSLFILNLRLFH